MFSFTGLTARQSEAMVEKHHIYMTKNGRISICGLTRSNIPYVAKAMKDVIENYWIQNFPKSLSVLKLFLLNIFKRIIWIIYV